MSLLHETDSFLHEVPAESKNLPIEIFLACVALMPLKSLILSRCVSKQWRHLVSLANIHPVRRRLLGLYDTIINTPYFLGTRPWTVDHIQAFDRKAYIESLTFQYPTVPDEFRIWILEWPARAVICGQWPGLPFVDCQEDTLERSLGVNFLGSGPPELSALITFHAGFIPALLISRTPDITTWLFFDERPEFCGKVHNLYEGISRDHGIIDPHFDSAEDDQDYDEYSDWIAYLEFQWTRTSKFVSSSLRFTNSNLDDKPIELDMDGKPLCEMGPSSMSDSTHTHIPAPPWIRRQEPQIQRSLQDHVQYETAFDELLADLEAAGLNNIAR